jgi:membrane-associated phospholipid phosphatase
VQDNLERILDTTVILVFFAMPTTIALGGAIFVPWQRAYWSLKHGSRMLLRHGWVLAGLVAMLVPMFIESQLDPYITQALGLDFTPYLRSLEDGLHQGIQESLRPAQPVLKPILATAYVLGYPVLIILTPALGVWLDKGILARRALAAYALCYAFAIPFYVFFPVNEVWYAYNTCPPGVFDLAACNQGTVQNLAVQFPFVNENIYAYNEINNCFPSLHTAMSVALAAVAWRSGAPRRYAAFAVATATLIVVATVYLGIHWVIDVVAGLALAALVVRLVERHWPDPGPEVPAPTAAA